MHIGSRMSQCGAAVALALSLDVYPVLAADPQSLFSRVYVDGFVNTDGKASGSIETIQPLAIGSAHTFFVQARAAYGDEWTLNGGVGYRHLLADKSIMLGVNAWHDWRLDEDHRRWGLGGEVMGRVMTLRGNYYGAYTGWRTIEDTSTFLVEERALSGMDVELETQVPFLPWARVATGWYHWDAKASGDIDGFSGRLKMDLTPFTRFETGVLADTSDTRGYFKLAVSLGAPRDVKYSLSETGIASSNAFDGRDLESLRLARVERRHEVVVEQRTTTKASGAVSGGVVFARGN